MPETYLVTGGAGSIGSHVVRRLLYTKPGCIVRAFSRNDSGQHALRESIKYEDRQRLRCILGDVRDIISVRRAVRGVDAVFHCAAMKHVDNSEYNACEVSDVNVRGTSNVLNALHDQPKNSRFVFLSTDKAANPSNVMGASKLVAEHIVMGATWCDNVIRTVTRFGNVWRTKGSVIPTFVENILKFGKIRVTDWGVTRYVLTIDDAVNTLMDASEYSTHPSEPVTLIPKMPAIDMRGIVNSAVKIADAGEPEIIFLGLQPNEKLHEALITADEVRRSRIEEKYIILMNQVTDQDDEHTDDPSILLPWLSSSYAEKVHDGWPD